MKLSNAMSSSSSASLCNSFVPIYKCTHTHIQQVLVGLGLVFCLRVLCVLVISLRSDLLCVSSLIHSPYSWLCSLPSTRQHPSNGDYLEVKREYYQNCSVLDCVTQCSQSTAHLCEQFLQVQQIGFVTLEPLRCA